MKKKQKKASQEQAEQRAKLADRVERLFVDDSIAAADLRRALRRMGIAEEDVVELQHVRNAALRLRDICLRLKGLAEEAARVETTDDRRRVLQRRADQLVAEYNDIVRGTDFGLTQRLNQKLDALGIYIH